MKKIVFLSILVSLALAISMFEAIIPLPVPIAGAKLGLANVVILVTIICFGLKEAIIVTVLKSMLLVLVTGKVASLPYSLTGAILSCIVMGIAYWKFRKYLSPVGISELGSFSFNVGQLFVAGIVLNNFNIFIYLPALLILGVFTGYFVGLSSIFISDKLIKVLK
ncbi:Gx transporter family protein [Miniphocaeibacter massiliensis]|uniref:Gx transporter family protein n=1 Tax=Miniphocaeibacter massiliensis TaxID=2041841 RepID=UPI001F5C4463|nr:Gx transporter family protein [Miniphocaeibacter massiliensis]